jgi:hypothetical protein
MATAVVERQGGLFVMDPPRSLRDRRRSGFCTSHEGISFLII